MILASAIVAIAFGVEQRALGAAVRAQVLGANRIRFHDHLFSCNGRQLHCVRIDRIRKVWLAANRDRF
jgi:hypothetical protein